MNKVSFTYNGREYQAQKIVELEPIFGERHIQITTQDNEIFELRYVPVLFRWVICKDYPKPTTRKHHRIHTKN